MICRFKLNPYQLLFVFLLLTIIYLTFQLFILNKLHIYNKIVIVNAHETNNNDKHKNKRLEIKEEYLLSDLNHWKYKEDHYQQQAQHQHQSTISPHIIEHIHIDKTINKINQTLNLFFHFQMIKHHKVSNTNENRLINQKFLPVAIRGINQNDAIHYQPDSNNQFTCLKSQVI